MEGLPTPGRTCVKDTPDESVVGMQQNTAKPKASSGGWRGRRSATMAARGVKSRIDSIPNRTAPFADKACMVSPLRMPRPDMTNMPVVVRLCTPELAACTPKEGARHLHCAHSFQHQSHNDAADTMVEHLEAHQRRFTTGNHEGAVVNSVMLVLRELNQQAGGRRQDQA